MARTGEVFVCSERHEIRSVSPICPELGVGFVEDGWSAAAANRPCLPGRPAAGYVTKRLAEDWLRGVIDEARRGTLPGMVKTGVSTYRSLLGSQILPRSAELPIESITPAMIESWLASGDRAAATRVKLLAMVHGVFQRFGTRMIAKADIRRVQEWMGHADIQTTMKYLHYAPRAEDARLVAEAFACRTPLAQQVCADT